MTFIYSMIAFIYIFFVKSNYVEEVESNKR